MANYVPLIINPGSTQIQELPANDNLDLANSSIANVVGITATGNIATGNILTDGYYYANGSPFVAGSNYGDSNVATYLGTFGSNAISTTGNVTAGYFIGNGSQLTGLPASYGDSNVVTLLGTFGSNTISTTGNVSTGNISASGTSSNIVRRAYGLFQTANAGQTSSAYAAQLDDIYASVSSTNQLVISSVVNNVPPLMTGYTMTMQSGSPTLQNWVNINISPNFSGLSGAMNNQGQGCECILTDQTPSAKMYRIIVVRSGTSGAMWNISIERLV